MSGSADLQAARAVDRRARDRAALERLADSGVLAALVDACGAPGVPDRVLARAPAGGACLYQGNDALVFRDRAPYLVRVDRAGLAWLLAPSADGGLGDTPWGVFTVSDAPFAEQVRHWRGWLTVAPPSPPPDAAGPPPALKWLAGTRLAGASPAGKSPAGEPMAFRFYDPRLTPVFLAACTPEEVVAFFGPARSLVVPAWDSAAPDGDGAQGPAGWMLTPGLAARGVTRPRRTVGERFRMRDAHLAAFRRRNFGDALIASVNREADALGQRATRDPADPTAGDVLLPTAEAGAPPVRVGFDARGFFGSVTSPLGRTWRIDSNERGHLTRLVTPVGASVTLRRDAADHITRVGRARVSAPDADAEVCTASYDAAGRPTAVAYPDGTRATLVYALAGADAPRAPSGARVSSITDRLGRTTRFAYDPYGDPIALTDAEGRVTRVGYGGWQGAPTGVAHADGRVERRSYDAAGRLAEVAWADGARLALTVDDQGRVVGLRTTPTPDGAPGEEVRLRYADGARPAVPAGANRPVTEARTYALDSLGREPARQTSAVHVAFDPRGRPVEERSELVVGDDAVARAASVRTAYNARGLVARVSYPVGDGVAFDYDLDGRLAAVTDWAGRTYSIAYPADGGWTLTSPSGVRHRVVQDGLGRVTALDVSAPDAGADREVARTDVSYDAEDRAASVRDSRLGAWTFAHDAEGQLVEARGPTEAESGRRSYSPLGTPARVERGVRRPEVLDCGRDAGGRLLWHGAVRLGYDARGNVASRRDGGPLAPGAEADLRPRPRVGAGAGGGWQYVYDARGQLVRAEEHRPGGVRRVVTFGYDAFGRRAWKLSVGPRQHGRLEARRTSFVWSGEQLIHEASERAEWPGVSAAEPVPADVVWSAVGARDYAYWPGTATPLLLRVTAPNDARGGGEAASKDACDDGSAGGTGTGGTTYLYHCDHLGAPVRLTDAAGRVVWEAAYAPFGAARLTVEEVTQPWRRPGQYADGETDLYYNRLRYYDPGLGQYLSPDPADPTGARAGLSPYAYARNSPLAVADPMGLWPSLGSIASVVVPALVGLAAGALVVALAPMEAPLLAVAGLALLAGTVAGALAGGVQAGFEQGFTCAECMLQGAARGAVSGFFGAIPFAGLELLGLAGAGAGVYAGAGAVSGGLGYIGDWLGGGAHPSDWSWGAFGGSALLGAATGGVGGRVLPKVKQWWGERGATPIEVSRSRYPESAQHIDDAQRAGHPRVLTIDRAGAKARRRAAVRGTPTQKGFDRDEYPPAMFGEGGAGSSVRHIAPGDNRGSGSSMGNQARELPDGTKVRIKTVK